jgi:hypothetical protein
MMYFIGVWLSLLPIVTVIGTSLLYRLQADRWRHGDRLIASLWLGLVTLAIGLLAVSLVLPLTPLVGILVMGSMTIVALLSSHARIALNRLWQMRLRPRLAIMVSLVVLVAAIVSRSVVWLDTGYYHYSSIQWLAQYGSVPGIALLFNNLGFTSSWFALAAPWNPALFAARSSAVVGGFAWLISLVHLLIAGNRIAAKTAQFSDWFAFIFMGLTALLNLFVKPFSVILISPSPDLPIFLLVGTIAWSILVTSQSESSISESSVSESSVSEPSVSESSVKMPWIDARAVPLILAAGAVTIKLTALPLLGVSSLFFVATRPFSLRRVAIGAGLVSLILLPYMASSVVTSGCPLYPSNALCFNLPWSPTAQAAHQIASNTHNWISWYGQPPAGANPWLWAMTQMIRASAKDAVTVGIVAVALGLALYILKVKIGTQRSLPLLRGEIWVCAIGMGGIGFLALTSVFLRFLMPYALVLFALFSAMLLADRRHKPLLHWEQEKSGGIKHSRATPFGLIGLTTCAIAINLYQTAGNSVLLPPPMPTDRIVRQETNGIVYASPQSGDVEQTVHVKHQLQKDMCWAAPLPCAYKIAPEVHLRQPQRGIAGGFIRR